VLAHELRNALSAAYMSLVVIKKGTVGMRGPTADVLDRSLALMGTLIDRSLAEVRLRTDSVAWPERFRLADALDQIRAMMRSEVENRNLDFLVEIDRDLEVETDRQFLMSALSNLVQNALKYTCTGTRVSLRIRRTSDRLVIEVEDECGGWPPGKAEELFRPFVRGKHQRPGMGLGLSIAMRAIGAINGEIHIRDLPGKGCIVIVDLPAVLVLPPPRAKKSRSKSGAKRSPAIRRQTGRSG
jgi:signal transduction histidine kinase